MDQRGVSSPARANAGGMCDRLLTFLANNLSMNRQQKNAAIEEGPRSGAGGGDRQLQKAEEEDEFAIRIERAEFELGDGRGGADGHGRVTATVLEEGGSTAAASDERQPKPAATEGAAAEPPVAATAAAAEEGKIRKTVTIKEDRPEDGKKGAPAAALDRKKSLFKKRQASTSSGGAAGTAEEQGSSRGAPRRSGLRPRMPAVLRVPSNINEKSSTFIEERRKSFGAGKKAADSK